MHCILLLPSALLGLALEMEPWRARIGPTSADISACRLRQQSDIDHYLGSKGVDDWHTCPCRRLVRLRLTVVFSRSLQFGEARSVSSGGNTLAFV